MCFSDFTLAVKKAVKSQLWTLSIECTKEVCVRLAYFCTELEVNIINGSVS